MTYADRIRALENARGKQAGGELDLEQPRAIFDTFVQTAVDSLLRLREDVEDQALEAFVDQMAACEAVHICAARGAYGIGAYCFYGLSQIGKRVHMRAAYGLTRTSETANPEARI